MVVLPNAQSYIRILESSVPGNQSGPKLLYHNIIFSYLSPHDRGKHSLFFLYSFVLSQTSVTISSSRWPRAATEYQIHHSSLEKALSKVWIPCLVRQRPCGLDQRLPNRWAQAQAPRGIAQVWSLMAAGRISSQALSKGCPPQISMLCSRGYHPLQPIFNFPSLLQPHEVVPDLCRLGEAESGGERGVLMQWSHCVGSLLKCLAEEAHSNCCFWKSSIKISTQYCSQLW